MNDATSAMPIQIAICNNVHRYLLTCRGTENRPYKLTNPAVDAISRKFRGAFMGGPHRSTLMYNSRLPRRSYARYKVHTHDFMNPTESPILAASAKHEWVPPSVAIVRATARFRCY